MEKEEWRTVDGWEDYQVSNLGNIRSAVAGEGGKIKYSEPFLPRRYQGYPTVGLRKYYLDFSRPEPWQVKTKKGRVHRLVAFAFLEKPANGKTFVNHKNGIRHDNRLENLEWVSHQENVDHAIHVLKRKFGPKPKAVLTVH